MDAYEFQPLDVGDDYFSFTFKDTLYMLRNNKAGEYRLEEYSYKGNKWIEALLSSEAGIALVEYTDVIAELKEKSND